MLPLILLCVLLMSGPAIAQPIPDSIVSPQPEPGGVLGWSVVSLGGDRDGDGIYEVAVGAPGEQGDALEDAGRVYLFSGGTGLPLDTLSSPNEAEGGNFGFVLAPAAADLDGDGVGDLLVGAPFEPVVGQALAGRAYAFSGASGQLLYEMASPQPEGGGRFGLAIASLRQDLDGDSVADLLIAAPFETAPLPEAGRVYLLSGANGSLIATFTDPQPEVESHFGRSLAALGGDPDVTGQPAWLVGARHKPDLPSGAGRVYRFSGSYGLPYDSAASPQPQVGGYFGRSLAPAGDLDGDQVPDWWAGAPDEAPSLGLARAGQVYAISGATGSVLYVLASPSAQGFGRFGQGIAAVGDLDQDGAEDLLVGAYQERGTTGLGQAGRAYLFSGADGQLLSILGSPFEQGNGFFGFTVAGLGSDRNGDGLPELLVAAPYERPDAAGRVYLFDGAQRNTTPLPVPLASQLTIFPNPSPGHLTLRSPGVPLWGLKVYQAQGREVWQQTWSGATQVALSLAQLPPGLYWLEIVSEAGIVRRPWLRR